MKKSISILFLAIVAAFSVSCENLDKPGTATVTTNEATEVSINGYTFNGVINYKGNSSCIGEGGFFYNNKPDVSDKNYMFSTQTVDLENGRNAISLTAKNYLEFFGAKTYYIKAGETLYYRAYARIISAESDTYIFGEEKSVVIPIL